MEIREKLHKLPSTSGVYLMSNIDGNIIYVGKAKNLKRRVSQYFNKNHKESKTLELVSNIYDFNYILTPSELDALGLESNLIKKYQPYYNILLKDDKSMPYIRINLKEDYPKVEIVRKVKKDGAKYFGPYFAKIKAYELIKTINLAFKLRSCKNNIKKPLKRECLNYSIGRCLAPCTRRISVSEYRNTINQVIDFLNGYDQEISKILEEKMIVYSENEQFEQAIIVRDRIKMVENLKNQVITQLPSDINIDTFSFASNGANSCIAVSIVRGGKMVGCECFTIFDSSLSLTECLSSFMAQYYQMNTIVPTYVLLPIEFIDKEMIGEYLNKIAEHKVIVEFPQKGVKHELLKNNYANAMEFLERQVEKDKQYADFTIGAMEQLKNKLSLKNMPLRMECYDISNISGVHKVASMVVFINGESHKSYYRKFIIKTVEGIDDFASIKEVIKRRLENITTTQDESFTQKPDLLVIDGGKGQLSNAYSAMQETGYDFEIISLAKREEEVFKPFISEPFILDKSSYGLRLLQRIRDESHRFAITFHRQKREKITSILENIEGVGKITSKKLIINFKSIESIAKASETELNEVGEINKSQAKKVYNYFNKSKQ